MYMYGQLYVCITGRVFLSNKLKILNLIGKDQSWLPGQLIYIVTGSISPFNLGVWHGKLGMREVWLIIHIVIC